MPWCAECDRFLSPSTVTFDGCCPRCGRAVDPGRARSASGTSPAPGVAAGPDGEPAGGRPAEDPDDHLPPAPWHLKLLVGAVALYLGWRAVQGIDWVLRQL